MTDSHAPFLAAIIGRPDLDLPRLVYADWLEETATAFDTPRKCTGCDGDGLSTGPPECRPCRRCKGTGFIEDHDGNGHAERAEFIRVQCRLAILAAAGRHGAWDTHGQQTCECETCALCRREWELLHPNGRELAFPGHFWLDPSVLQIVTQYTLEDRDYVWRRGFVESLSCSWSDFRTHAAAIRKATPLRKVRLTGENIPAADWYYYKFDRIDGDRCRSEQYPGIEFKLPQRAVLDWEAGALRRPTSRHEVIT